jgi:hypothetical protein
MNTHRLNPIEAMFATLTGLPAEETLACGNWARLRATPRCTRVARPFIISVDPMLLALAAARPTAVMAGKLTGGVISRPAITEAGAA